MRRPLLFVIPIVLLFTLIVLMQSNTPRPENWTPSFTRTDKIPYGGFILYALLPTLLGGADVAPTSMPMYNALSGEETGTTYFFLNSDFNPDELEVEALKDFVERGNTAFISAQWFSSVFSDEFGIRATSSLLSFQDSLSIRLVNPRLGNNQLFRFRESSAGYYINEFDTNRTTILGVNSLNNPTFVRVECGDGELYVHTIPLAFTNYNLLDTVNARYAIASLSYLPRQRVMWDEYYKEGKVVADNPMQRVILEEPLQWGMYSILAATLLFVLLFGRRRQRIIPVLPPVKNTTLEFVETVGRLYYRHGDHANLAAKKIIYFFDYLRSTFGVDTNRRDTDFIRSLSGRSGVPEHTIITLLRSIDLVQTAPQIGEEELGALNQQIEKFRRLAKR